MHSPHAGTGGRTREGQQGRPACSNNLCLDPGVGYPPPLTWQGHPVCIFLQILYLKNTRAYTICFQNPLFPATKTLGEAGVATRWRAEQRLWSRAIPSLPPCSCVNLNLSQNTGPTNTASEASPNVTRRKKHNKHAARSPASAGSRRHPPPTLQEGCRRPDSRSDSKVFALSTTSCGFLRAGKCNKAKAESAHTRTRVLTHVYTTYNHINVASAGARGLESVERPR